MGLRNSTIATLRAMKTAQQDSLEVFLAEYQKGATHETWDDIWLRIFRISAINSVIKEGSENEPTS